MRRSTLVVATVLTLCSPALAQEDDGTLPPNVEACKRLLWQQTSAMVGNEAGTVIAERQGIAMRQQYATLNGQFNALKTEVEKLRALVPPEKRPPAAAAVPSTVKTVGTDPPEVPPVASELPPVPRIQPSRIPSAEEPKK